MWDESAPQPRTIWVARLHISGRTADKLRGAHHLEPAEVEDEVLCCAGLDFSWHWHDERGWRAIIQVLTGRGLMWVVLYPTPKEDEWNLGSAYFD